MEESIIKLNIDLDNNKNIPLYRRIAYSLEKKIKAGEIPPGSKLPTVRKLSSQLHVSTGTILHTYEYLVSRELIAMQQGKGTFVLGNGLEIKHESTKELAIELIDSLIHSLADQEFSYKEIEMYFESVLRKHRAQALNIRLGIIDCNPEALYNMCSQLNFLENVSITPFLLSEIDSLPVPYDTNIDIAITTYTHFEELSKKTTNELQILPIALEPSSHTIVNLSKIQEASKVGICTQSKRFSEIIKNRLNEFIKTQKNKVYLFQSEESFRDFCSTKELLIVPYRYQNFCTSEETELLDKFKQIGGRILEFNYQIDRGSLLHISKSVEFFYQQLLDDLT